METRPNKWVCEGVFDWVAEPVPSLVFRTRELTINVSVLIPVSMAHCLILSRFIYHLNRFSLSHVHPPTAVSTMQGKNLELMGAGWPSVRRLAQGPASD